MASASDLAGVLRHEADCFLQRLERALDADRVYPVALKAYFRAEGTTSEAPIGGEPVIIRGGGMDAAPGAVEELERRIVDELGPAPYGVLRLKAHDDKSASKPFIDMQRRLLPADVTGAGNPSVALVRSELEANRRMVMQLHSLLIQNNAQLTQIVVSQNHPQATLATTRVVPAAAADGSGLSTIVTMGALVLLYPVIQRSLGLRPGTALDETITVAMQWLRKDGTLPQLTGPGVTASGPPLEAYAPGQAPPTSNGSNGHGSQPGAAAVTADRGAELRAKLTEVLDLAKLDPTWRAELVRTANADPRIAYAAAQAAGIPDLALGDLPQRARELDAAAGGSKAPDAPAPAGGAS
jgi:hypothetical protein